jgi:predicted Fe-Mo cluster-binding NifX family protein
MVTALMLIKKPEGATEQGAIMKIAISSQGEKLDSAVDLRFSRAAQFILYDIETDSCEIVPNEQMLNAVQGAEIKAAETISRHGGQVLITGYCGPETLEMLAAAGIEIILGAEGLTVSQVLEKYKSGQLKASGSSDAAGHWQ